MKNRHLIITISLCIAVIFFAGILFAQEQFLLTASDIPNGYELLSQEDTWKMTAAEGQNQNGIWQRWGKFEDSLYFLIDIRYCEFDSEPDALQGVLYYSQNNNDVMALMQYGGIDGHIIGDLSWYISDYDSSTGTYSYTILFLKGNAAVLFSKTFTDSYSMLELCNKLVNKIETNLSGEIASYEESLKNSRLSEMEFNNHVASFVTSQLADYSVRSTFDSRWMVNTNKIFMGIRKKWQGNNGEIVSIDLCEFESVEDVQQGTGIFAECSTPVIFDNGTCYHIQAFDLSNTADMGQLTDGGFFTNDYSFVGYKNNLGIHVHFYNPEGIKQSEVYSAIKALAGEI